MSSDVTENTCRICRGEATTLQPLYHPCKCRGSIKYVHQDCLMEWLKHANKSTEKCDICDTPYKFRIIYDPAMPRTIPIRLIWKKLLQIASSTFVKAIAITLYILCILIQVPLFLKFAGRFYTWAIDGSLPSVNQTLMDALFFGEYDINGYLSNNSSESITHVQIVFMKLRKFLGYTYFSGVRYILAAIVIHIALFIEREWVVRDEGYLKLLYKKIGKEPRTKLVDMLQNALQGLRNDGNNGDAAAAAHLQRFETLAQAINDLQNENDDINEANEGEEGLRRAINDNQLFTNEEDPTANVYRDRIIEQGNIRGPVPNQPQAAVPAYNENVAVAPPRNFIHEIFGDDNDDEDDRDYEDDNEDEDDEGTAGETSDDESNLVDEDDEEAAAIAAAAAAVAGNGNGNNLNNQGQGGAIAEFLEMFGITLSVTTPIYLMLLFDFVIAVYLFLIYLIPHMLGNVVVMLVGVFLHMVNVVAIYAQFYNYVLTKLQVAWFREVTGYLGFVHSNFIQPVTDTIGRLFVARENSYTWFDRLILLFIGYGIIAGVTHKIMQILNSNDGKPISGTPRKVFKVLFEIACTLKVHMVFTTEIFLFPCYCGLLLDFCATPFLPERKFLLVSSHYEALQVPYIRCTCYWSSGTLLMAAIALLVDSARKNVLRKGVLFFLRTPDDPNIRLIHDALVVPLSTQAYRIWLTLKVYTVFIAFGIGCCMWTMAKLVGTPDYWTLFIITAVFMVVAKNREVIKEHGLEYLRKVIITVAHKIRLSHYLIGVNHESERGYFVSWFDKLIGKDRGVQGLKVEEGVFVPDGNYLRCPASDSFSKKLLKNMFVKVTSLDQLIESQEDQANNNNNENENESDTDASLEESTSIEETTYQVIYTPPFFKTRAYLSVVLIFIFSIFVPLLFIYACLMAAGKVMAIVVGFINIPASLSAGAYVVGILVVSGLSMAIVFGLFRLLKQLLGLFSRVQQEVIMENYMKGRELENSNS